MDACRHDSFTWKRKYHAHMNERKHPQTGNASNPAPDENLEPQNREALIDEKGEKYLREVSNPEDYPDPQEADEAEDTVAKEAD